VTGRRGRRHKQVLDYLKEGENTGNWLDSLRTGCERGYGFLVRETGEWMNDIECRTSL
jgi:hypothetical protein